MKTFLILGLFAIGFSDSYAQAPSIETSSTTQETKELYHQKVMYKILYLKSQITETSLLMNFWISNEESDYCFISKSDAETLLDSALDILMEEVIYGIKNSKDFYQEIDRISEIQKEVSSLILEYNKIRKILPDPSSYQNPINLFEAQSVFGEACSKTEYILLELDNLISAISG